MCDAWEYGKRVIFYVDSQFSEEQSRENGILFQVEIVTLYKWSKYKEKPTANVNDR